MKNKIVLVRVDFNVALDKKGRVQQEELFRLQRTVPTIKYLIRKRARIVLLTHLGRPGGKPNKKLSNKPLALALKKLLGKPVKMLPGVIEEKVQTGIQNIKPGQVVILENLRFYAGEDAGSTAFAKQLACLGDAYVNDAFAFSHRNAASIVKLPEYLPAYAGLLLEQEVQQLQKVLDKPKHPFVLVMGGAKTKTKLVVIKKLLPKVDHVLVGGIVANTLLKAAGTSIGSSVYDADLIASARPITKKKKLILPSDVVCDTIKTPALESELKDLSEVKRGERIIDVGTVTAVEFAGILRTAKTIFFNGPLGFMEKPEGMHGSQAVAEFIAALSAKKQVTSIIGGGETIALFDRLNILDQVQFVSTGGGALLHFLAHGTLPGIEALKK